MDERAKLKRKAGIVFREEDDVGLLFDPDTGKVNILNVTGKFIWSRLEAGKFRADLTAELAEEFDMPDRNKAEDDLDVFVKDLGRRGFLEDYIDIPDLPRSVCFGITSRCNLNCKHCLNRNIAAPEPDMTTEELLGVVDQMGRGGTSDISLFGGEPLVHPDFRRIVEHINKYPISISLNTNGSLVDAETARWLKDHKIKGAVVSFDGSNSSVMDSMRGTGAFEASIEGIKALREEGLSVLLSATLTRLNYKDARQMVILGKKIRGSSIRFNHVFFGGNAACFVKELYLSPDEEREAVDVVWRLKAEFGDFISGQSSYLCQKAKLDKVRDYKPVYDKITVSPCGAANGKCAIRPDGWVTPCEIIWDVKCGNLKEKSLGEIWRSSEKMNLFRKPMEVDLKELPECQGCAYQYLCFIGHRCYPYHNPGGAANKELYCWRNGEK